MNSNAALPRTMRAAVMYDVGDIRIEERPLPNLEPGDVLVRTGASGVCSGDLMPWYVRRKAPFVFGHEPAGTVVAYGGAQPGTSREGRRVRLGDRVFAHHHAACLNCDHCVAGRFVHCAAWRSSALEPGGMAEFFRLPRANLADTLVLPDEVSFADGSLVEPLACVVKSLRRAFPVEIGRRSRARQSAGSPERDTPPLLHATLLDQAGALAGCTLYVIGAGVMGLMHVAVAAFLGAEVYASDFLPERQLAALRMGAHEAFSPAEAPARLSAATDGQLAHSVICGPGNSAALAHAVASVASDGTVVMFTPIEPEERFEFDQSPAYFRDVRLVASYSCGPDDTLEALRLICGGIVTSERLRATEFPFPAVGAAYEQMRAAQILKAIVTFPQDRAALAAHS